MIPKETQSQAKELAGLQYENEFGYEARVRRIAAALTDAYAQGRRDQSEKDVTHKVIECLSKCITEINHAHILTDNERIDLAAKMDAMTAEVENYRSIAERAGATIAVSELAEAQATVTAQQEEIGRLRDGQHKAAWYDFILTLSRLELAEMSPEARVVWERLVRGGWYTDDLEELLRQALAAKGGA